MPNSVDGLSNAGLWAPLFNGKNELTRKDVLELAHKESLSGETNALAQQVLSVFDELDSCGHSDGLITKNEIDGINKQELNDLVKESEDSYESLSAEKKLETVVDDAKKFLKATDSKDLLKKLESFEKEDRILLTKEIKKIFDGTSRQEIEMDFDLKYDNMEDTIKVHPDMPNEMSRAALTGAFIHELIHATSPGKNSAQEELDAYLVTENYKDLFGEGFAPEGEEEDYYKENFIAYGNYKLQFFLQGSDGFSKGHQNPVEFQSPFDSLEEDTSDMNKEKATEVVIDNFKSIVTEQKLLGFIPWNPFKNDELSSWDDLMKAYNTTDDEEFKSAIEWWCKHKDEFNEMEGLCDNGKTDGKFLLSELKQYKEKE